jgi:tetratricopeptide (TPR) repeat protein
MAFFIATYWASRGIYLWRDEWFSPNVARRPRAKDDVEMAEKQESCDAFEILISEYVCDGPLELSETERTALEGHLASCDGCRKRHAAWGKAEGRLRQMFPLVRQLTAEDVPESVSERTSKGITDRINGHSGTRVLSVATKCHARKRTNAKWVFWGSAAAALILLAAGFAAFRPSPRQRPDQSVAEAAIERGSAPKSVSQLRHEFDQLAQKNGSRQISVRDFERGVRAIIADGKMLLAREDLPEANAIHAQTLVADAHGALAEYAEEFGAYIVFAERLAEYYDAHPDEFVPEVPEGLSVGREVVLRCLLTKANEYQRAARYLPAVNYYKEVNKRFRASDYGAYALYDMGKCYLAYDLPKGAEECHEILLNEYPDSHWAIPLLDRKARSLLAQGGKATQAAEIYLRIGNISSKEEEKVGAWLVAAGLLLKAGKTNRADELTSSALALADSDEQRRLVRQFRVYALAQERDMDGILNQIISQ